MGLKERLKKCIHEFLHPSFESLMHEFAIVEDSSAMNEERLEHFKFIIEQKRMEEAERKLKEEKMRMKEEAREAKKAAKEAAKEARNGKRSGGA